MVSFFRVILCLVTLANVYAAYSSSFSYSSTNTTDSPSESPSDSPLASSSDSPSASPSDSAYSSSSSYSSGLASDPSSLPSSLSEDSSTYSYSSNASLSPSSAPNSYSTDSASYSSAPDNTTSTSSSSSDPSSGESTTATGASYSYAPSNTSSSSTSSLPVDSTSTTDTPSYSYAPGNASSSSSSSVDSTSSSSGSSSSPIESYSSSVTTPSSSSESSNNYDDYYSYYYMSSLYTYFQYQDAISGWDPCTPNAYTPQGFLDVSTMLYNCSKNIPSSLDPPSYFAPVGTKYEPTFVYMFIGLGNLISVDDIASTMTIQIEMEMFWVDNRINIPDAWAYMNPSVKYNGIDITEYIRNQNQLDFWLPDVYFQAALDVETNSEAILLRQFGELLWLRTLTLTLAEPQMSLKRFPLDYQNFSIIMQTWYDPNLVQIYFRKESIYLLVNSQNNQTDIEMNELWSYVGSSSYTADDNVMYMNVKFKRQPLGFIYRLGLPVTIFLVIVGLSFWANLEQRIDVTLQMLLVTSAMYIIVGQVIPFVGYLTVLDIFITVVFIILSVTVGVHFWTLVLDRKKFKYPLNSFFRDLLVYVFKAVWIPLALVLFIVMFEMTTPAFIFTLVAVCVTCFVSSLFHVTYLKRSFKVSVLNLRVKEKRFNEMLLFKINNPNKLMETNFRNTVTDDKEDEVNPFGKNIRLSRLERAVLKWTSVYYQDEVIEEVKSNRLDKLADLHLQGVNSSGGSRGIFSDYFNGVKPNDNDNIRKISGGASSTSNGHAAPPTANPMRQSISDVYDSDDEIEMSNFDKV